MPFITNDFHHLLVDDDDFDRNPEKYKHYVVARRLLITSQEPFSVTYLKERFQKYGEISSAKVLTSNLEGFVTFKCDRHACLAYDWEKDKCKDKKVRVDSTWHQPDERIRIDSEWNTYEDDDDISELDDSLELDNAAVEAMDAEFSSPLLLLNDDSLFALFDHCDKLSLVNLSKTCKRLANLLKSGSYYFPNHKSFHKEYNDKLSLIDLENIFKLMGRHFDKLNVWFKAFESSDAILRYVRIIGKYCHDGNVKDLFLIMPFWINEVWLELVPVLKNLSKLEFSIIYNYERDVTADLSELCPNLDTLSLTDSFIVGKSLKKTVPSLKKFIFPYIWYDLTKLDSYEFFYANRQLKLFECVHFNFENVALLSDLLPNIDTLRLFNALNLASSNNILGLQNFQNLRNLTLSCFSNDYGYDKAKIIDCCGQLKNLLELKLCFFKITDEKEPVRNLSNTFAHIERLQLVGVHLDERSVLDYVRTASKIKVMHFHECNVYATESLIVGLRDIMGKSSQRYRSECSLFVDDNVNHNFIAINNQEVKSAAWVCKHRNF